jgi:hypothetical protein
LIPENKGSMNSNAHEQTHASLEPSSSVKIIIADIHQCLYIYHFVSAAGSVCYQNRHRIAMRIDL